MLWVFLLVAVLACPLPAQAGADSLQESTQTTPSDLIKRVKVLSPEEAGFSSLVVESSYFGGPDAVVNFRLLFQGPESYAFFMLDGFDGTPLLVVAQENALLYDPMKDHLLHTGNTGVLFRVGFEKDQFVLNGAFQQGTRASKPVIRNTVVIDLPAILDQMRIDLRSEQSPQGDYVLSGHTVRQGYCEAHIDPAAAVPLTRMAIYPRGHRTPIFAFNRIEANTHIDGSRLAFPMDRLRASGLPVREMLPGEIENADMSHVAKAIFLRSALRHPERRGEVVQMGFRDVPWSTMRERDPRVSSALRELFHTD